MGFPILVRWHLYIESGPWGQSCLQDRDWPGFSGLAGLQFRWARTTTGPRLPPCSSCDDTIMTIPQSAILRMADSHLDIRNSVLKWLRPCYTELIRFYCNDNAAKRDFQSQTAYSQFGMDIVIRSGIIYDKWPNLKRESLDASIIWFWTNSQGTGD